MTHDDKKWDKVLVTEITNIAKQWQEQEEEHLAKQDLEEKTINEENEEASKQLEEISQEEPKEEKEKYPY